MVSTATTFPTFSNTFSENICQRIYEQLLAVARPRARLAYWNMLVPRTCPAPLVDRVRRLSRLDQRLFAA